MRKGEEGTVGGKADVFQHLLFVSCPNVTGSSQPPCRALIALMTEKREGYLLMFPVIIGVRLRPTYKPQVPAKRGIVERRHSHPLPWGMISDSPVLYSELQSLLLSVLEQRIVSPQIYMLKYYYPLTHHI